MNLSIYPSIYLSIYLKRYTGVLDIDVMNGEDMYPALMMVFASVPHLMRCALTTQPG